MRFPMRRHGPVDTLEAQVQNTTLLRGVKENMWVAALVLQGAEWCEQCARMLPEVRRLGIALASIGVTVGVFECGAGSSECPTVVTQDGGVAVRVVPCGEVRPAHAPVARCFAPRSVGADCRPAPHPLAPVLVWSRRVATAVCASDPAIHTHAWMSTRPLCARPAVRLGPRPVWDLRRRDGPSSALHPSRGRRRHHPHFRRNLRLARIGRSAATTTTTRAPQAEEEFAIDRDRGDEGR